MNKFTQFEAVNGMSFGSLNLNLDSPGMNLIMGENQDDISGNSSRNGCGKSNIFNLLNYHLFERGLDLINFRSKSGIINSEAGKDYMTKCVWKPAIDSGFMTSYQYQKYQDWGTGAYLIKNGGWDDFAAKKEGVEDLSQWVSKDTQRSFQEYLNLNWMEWNLLVNLTNVDDDKDDPFFTNRDRIQRLEIFQSLFKMDYSAAHQEVKARLSTLKKQIENDSTAIESALNVLRSQLDELQDADILNQSITESRTAIDKYSLAVAQLSSKVESQEAKKALIAEFDALANALIQSGIESSKFANNSIQEEYATCRHNLETTQQAIADLRVQITQMQHYESLATRLAATEEAAKYYLDSGYTVEGIRQTIADNNQVVSKQYRYQQLTSKYSWLSEYGETLQDSATYILDNSAMLMQDLNGKLTDLTTEKSALSNEQSAHTFIVNQLLPKTKKLLAQLDACKADFNNQASNERYADSAQQYELAKDNQYQVQLKLQSAQSEYTQIQHKIEHMSSGVCPTCNQTLPDFEESEKARLELQDQLQKQEEAVKAIETELQQCQVDLEALKEGVQKYSAFNAAKINLDSAYQQISELMGDEAEQVSDEFIAEKEAESRSVLENAITRLKDIEQEHRSISLKANQLASVVAEELQFIIGHTPCNIADLEGQNTQLNSISQSLISLNDQRANIASSKEQVQLLLDENHTSATLQQLLQQHIDYSASARQYITWAEAVIPMLERINDSKFKDVESLRWMMDDEEGVDDRESLENIRILLQQHREVLSHAEYSLKQRLSLEARIKQQEEQNEELGAMRKRYKALQALEVMCGPNGLVYSRLEVIFQQINAIMNNYMTILIPEGGNINKRVTTYFEMTDNGPIQTVYRGDAPIVKLSRSEKARVKLARTLAFREFSLPVKQCNILLIDELDGSSCDTNKERIWECVRAHVERFPNTSVFAVSHSAEMQTSALWDRTFKVAKKDGFSTLEEV